MQTKLESKTHVFTHSSIHNVNTMTAGDINTKDIGASITKNIVDNMTKHIIKYPIHSAHKDNNTNNAQKIDSKRANTAIAESKPESNHKPTKVYISEIQITIESRIFSLNLGNLETRCRETIIRLFKDKNYSLEELLVLLLTNIRDQSIAEIELNNILQSLKSTK